MSVAKISRAANARWAKVRVEKNQKSKWELSLTEIELILTFIWKPRPILLASC